MCGSAPIPGSPPAPILGSQINQNWGGGAAPDISVAVVSYNTCGLLRACLRSLTDRQAAGEAVLEIIVADNGSTDGSAGMVRAEFPSVRWIDTGSNLGFGRANNLALQSAQGRAFCLLNSDAEVLPGALSSALHALESGPKIGLVGGQLLWPDGQEQASHGVDPTLRGVWEEQIFWGATVCGLGRNPRRTACCAHCFFLNFDLPSRVFGGGAGSGGSF